MLTIVRFLKSRMRLAALAVLALPALISPVMAQGDPTVAQIQSLLIELGYAPGPVDGVEGGGTKAALGLFNAVENLPTFNDEVSGAEGRMRILERLRAVQAAGDAADPPLFIPIGGGISTSDSQIADDGSIFVSYSNGIARFWDVAAGQQFRALRIPKLFGADSPYANWALSRDGRYFAAGGEAIMIVEVKTGKVLRRFAGRDQSLVTSLAIRPNSTEIYAAEGKYITKYDWSDGSRGRVLGEYGNVNWTENGRNYYLKPDYYSASAVAVSPDGRYLATGGSEWGARIYDLESGRLLHKIKGPNAVAFDELRFSGDGSALYATAGLIYTKRKGYNGRLFVIDTRTWGIRDTGFHSATYAYPIERGLRVNGEKDEDSSYAWYTVSVDGSISSDGDHASPQITSPSGSVAAHSVWVDGVSGVRFAFSGGTEKHATAPSVDYRNLFDRAYFATRKRWRLDAATGRAQGWAITPEAPEFDSYDDESGEVHALADPSRVVVLGGKGVDDEASKYSSIKTPADTLTDANIGDFRVFDAETGDLFCKSTERSHWPARDYQLVTVEAVGERKAPWRAETGSFGWSDALQQGFLWSNGEIVVIDDKCETVRRIAVNDATDYRWKLGGLFAHKTIHATYRPHYYEGFVVSGDGNSLLAWRPEQAVQRIDPRTGEVLGVYRTTVDNGANTYLPEEVDFLRRIPEQLNVRKVLSLPGTNDFLVHAFGGSEVGPGDRWAGSIVHFSESSPEARNAYRLHYFDLWAASQGGKYLAIGREVGVQVLDPRTGKVISSPDMPAQPEHLTFSDDGSLLFVLGADGFHRTFDPASGRLLASTIVFYNDEWLTITPEGFFTASEQGAAALYMRLDDTEVAPIGAAYQALYRPDLVAEALAGDPDGRVREAAAKLDLETVMDSGLAPRVVIASPAGGTTLEDDTVEASARITDLGGGIGKVEWRVNGVTLGLNARGFDRLSSEAVGGAFQGETVTVSQALTLDPGENRIEVVAYNAEGLIASEAAAITVTWDGETLSTPPTLHVLAVGVNDYWDSRLQLNYAASDARAVAAALETAGAGLYQSVETTLVLDADVTAEGLEKVFDALSAKVLPRDVFVMFMAGHGKTEQGQYYFLPQDFRYSNETSVAEHGIGQEQFQQWLARIPARKSVLLYDTCESGSLVGGGLATRGLEEVAALERMTRAMGRTVLSASTDSTPALEGYNGYGVFTYAFLQALGAGDSDRDGTIAVTELAGAVDRTVPEISFAAFNFRQVPQMRIMGSDFPLTRQAEVLTAAVADAAPQGEATAEPEPEQQAEVTSGGADTVEAGWSPTHVAIASSDLHEAPNQSATVLDTLAAGTLVKIIGETGEWRWVERAGEALGFVRGEGLVPVQ